MRHAPCRTALALLTLATAACSTAGNGSAASESASASPAGAAAPTPGLPRPESLPHSEPSMLGELPIVATPASGSEADPRTTIARLEREARAIAKSTGCNSVAACRSAPVGVKACGGPRSYVTYCAATTDTVALMRKLRELERVEKAYNASSGMMSTCEMRLPPTTELVGTTCRETPETGQGRIQ